MPASGGGCGGACIGGIIGGILGAILVVGIIAAGIADAYRYFTFIKPAASINAVPMASAGLSGYVPSGVQCTHIVYMRDTPPPPPPPLHPCGVGLMALPSVKLDLCPPIYLAMKAVHCFGRNGKIYQVTRK